MSINREATICWKGYDPDDLKPKSNKRVWANCDICGYGRWVSKGSYCDLCRKCADKESGIKRKCDPIWRKAQRDGIRRKVKDPKWIDAVNKGMRKRSNNLEWRINVAQGNRDKAKDSEWQKKMKILASRYSNDINHAKKISAGWQGIPYDEWESFASDHEYCPLFNEKCKESNRDKYDRKCFLCELLEEENITSTGKQQHLGVHHYDMNKNQGCDDIKWKLVPLCIHCHGFVHNKLWESRITWLLKNVWI